MAMSMPPNEDNSGYLYHPRRTTTGIFFEDGHGHGPQRFLNWCPIPIPSPLFPPVNPLPTICSSSQGLAVLRSFYDPMSIYYVCNPFISSPTAYTLLIRPPRNHHPDHTETVLITDFSFQTAIFHLVCAVHEQPGIYTFDIYSSNTCEWQSIEHSPLGCNILPNSGVSSKKTAFWLTDKQDSTDVVLRLNVAFHQWDFSFLEQPYEIISDIRMQLGRVGDTVALVIVSELLSGVDMYIWDEDEGEFDQYGFLRVEIRDDVNLDPDGELQLYDTVVELTVRCREMPRPIRFESFKMEVLFWVDGLVMVWESNYRDINRARLKILVRNAPIHIADGVPHVWTYLLPTNFILNGIGRSVAPPVLG